MIPFNEYAGALLVGDSLEWLDKLPAKTYQCCVTSPPYYGFMTKTLRRRK